MRTCIYIDGFNFYYRAVRKTPYKWLDFKALFKKVLRPEHNILAIKYFTAFVTGKFDPRHHYFKTAQLVNSDYQPYQPKYEYAVFLFFDFRENMADILCHIVTN